ncbi:hypothetical protein BOTNAR_0088g00170 [Botryotinia narcissicola]|uniref:Metallo-beta-lactamase domain-containing protein n=1 Tax=Botryotinia narcissicola TaxID=278944 RepID=A0A4Z1J6K0_9HELO|nr:hypothetical protein BOTNAR_0088g00170 [Botryotinia narcissicola]
MATISLGFQFSSNGFLNLPSSGLLYFQIRYPPMMKQSSRYLNRKFHLEDYLFQAFEVGQSDTYNTTVLHIPCLELVITGDAVYGECFQYLVETNTGEIRAEWIRAVDKIESLRPKIVVPSHKQIWDGYGRDHLENTRQYIKNWEILLEVTTSAEDLKEKITALYAQRVGVWILGISINEVFPNQNSVKGRDFFPAPMM